MSLTHLEAPHGDNRDFIVALTDVDGSRFDPDTATQIWWLVKETLADADADAILQKTLGSGISADTDDNGKKVAVLTWSAAEAAGLEANRAYYTAVRVLKANGKVFTPIEGLLSTTAHAVKSYS